jgi:hypothetical protein
LINVSDAKCKLHEDIHDDLFFFSVSGVWNQVLTSARRTLYHWASPRMTCFCSPTYAQHNASDITIKSKRRWEEE